MKTVKHEMLEKEWDSIKERRMESGYSIFQDVLQGVQDTEK